MGDVKALAESIKQVGLLHPIVITPDNTLSAGERRLCACKELGWTEIPVTVAPLDDIVKGEFAENAIRKDFTPSEIDAIRRRCESVVKEQDQQRKAAAGPSDGRGAQKRSGERREGKKCLRKSKSRWSR